MRLVAALVGCGVIALAAPARAGESGLRLTWSAPDGCPNADDVRAAALRDSAENTAPGNEVLEAEAAVEPIGSAGETARTGWRVRLRTRRGIMTGEREIEAATCSGVAEATAVVLALALVPPAATSVEQEQKQKEEQSTVATSRPEERDVSSGAGPHAKEAERHAFALGLSVAGDAATLPAATAGGSLTLAWARRRFRVELDARRWASQSQSLSRSDSGARFSTTSLGGRACWAALRASGLELAPCGGVDVHLVTAPGYGADANFSASAAWTTVTGGGLGRFELASWLALRARAEAFVPLTRPTFVVQNEGAVHRPSAVGAGATFGVEVLFL